MKNILSCAASKATTAVKNLKKSEVAEALIATWCIEFLRVRRAGGFNVVEIIAISALMMGVKAVVTEASKRKYHDTKRAVVVSGRSAQVGAVEIR